MGMIPRGRARVGKLNGRRIAVVNVRDGGFAHKRKKAPQEEGACEPSGNGEPGAHRDLKLAGGDGERYPPHGSWYPRLLDHIRIIRSCMVSIIRILRL